MRFDAVSLAALLVLSTAAPSCARVSAQQTSSEAEARQAAPPDRPKTIEAGSTSDGGNEPREVPLPPDGSRKLTVTFFDVGQGDAALIQTPSGKTVLIDGGPPEAGPTLVRQLRALGVSVIDLVIASHAHADHIGGLIDVVREFKVRAFLDSGVPHTTPTFRDYLAEVERQKEKNGAKFLVARRGRTITLDDGAVTLDVLAPEEPLLSGTRSDINSNSVVVRLSFGAHSVLFTGDAEAGTEERLAKQSDKVRATVLKVAHHGGRHSTTAPFLRAVSPSTAIISCGRGNPYGHPKAKTIKALEAVAKVYRTDRDGTITITSDGKAFDVARSGIAKADEVQQKTSSAYVASRRAKTFHRSDCPGAAKIRATNRVGFGTWGEAAASGRRPHRGCMR